MKVVISLFYILFYQFVSCQNSFILKKDGTRIEVQKNSVQIIMQDKVLSYKSISGSLFELDFKEISEAFFGNFKFKNFKLSDNKVSNCYFVLAESENFTLLSVGIPEGDSDEDSINMKIKYQMLIIDKSNVVVDSLLFSNAKTVAAASARSMISEKIYANFRSCDNLITRFEDIERENEPQYMSLIGFFKVPKFVFCVN